MPEKLLGVLAHLPEDTAPLRAAIERVAASEVEVALFSSATQVENVFRVAVEMVGRADALRDAFRGRTVVASIGPITTAALQEHGVESDLHPEHPKMGHLVAEVARQAAERWSGSGASSSAQEN